jgi:O-antigen/teichoic acid export membrane protein
MSKIMTTGGRRVERQTLLVAVLRLATYATGMATAVLVSRVLGPHDRGIWAVALLIAGIVALASEVGVGTAVLRLAREDQRRREGVAGTALLLVCTTSCLAALCLGGILHFTRFEWATGTTLMAAVIGLLSVVPVNVSSVCRQALLEDGDVPGVAGGQLGQAVTLVVLVGLGFVLFGPRVLVAVSAFVLAQVVVALWSVHHLARRGLLVTGVQRHVVAALLKNGLQAHVGTVALFLAYRVDLLLVNQFLGLEAAGVYSVALTLSEMLRALPEAGQIKVFSMRQAVGEPPPGLAVARRVLLATALVGGVAGGLSYWVIPAVFGHGFAAASPVFVLLVPGVAALAVSYCLAPSLILAGRLRANSVVAAIGLVAMVLTDLLTIPRWGLLGAAGTSSAAYLLVAWLQVCLVRQTEPFRLTDLVPAKADLVGYGTAIVNLLRGCSVRRFH